MTTKTTITVHRDAVAAAERAAEQARRDALDHETRRYEERVKQAPATDRELLDRWRAADRALQQQERAARQAFASALLASDDGRAWIEARACLFRRQRLASDARAAAERLGERGPGEISHRDPDLAGDIEAVLEAAALDAATPEPDVEQDPAPHLDPRLTAQLVHAAACPQDRLEAVAHGVRCVGCGASKVVPPPPEPLPPSDSEQYRKLWRNHPSKIVEALTDAERANPRLNPQHPNADAEPPAWFGGRPTR
jgi:hypothetical protein